MEVEAVGAGGGGAGVLVVLVIAIVLTVALLEMFFISPQAILAFHLLAVVAVIVTRIFMPEKSVGADPAAFDHAQTYAYFSISIAVVVARAFSNVSTPWTTPHP